MGKKYLNDEKYIKIINTSNIEEKYSLIYDYLCNYLDNDMKENNHCDFKEGKCIASRKGKTVHEMDGCCWQRGVGKCTYLTKEGTCPIRCVSCKFFMCSYLENKGVKYKPNKIFPLKKFFNRKQINIIRRTYFRPKEEIIEKLMKAM